MTALEILSDEHGLIRQYLDNLSFALEILEREGRPPKEFFEKMVDFSTNFANKYHHLKEEQQMFGLLAQSKGGEFDAAISALRDQHELGRNYVAKIASTIESYALQKRGATTIIIENLAPYISMLRRHIHREDHIFYPLVEKELSDEQLQLLLKEFYSENQKFGSDFFERYRRIVIEMGKLVEA
jgi:hemerythrin-like domain-containing protein